MPRSGAAVGLVALLLRQPLIVGLIGAGILAGPAVLGIARSDEHIALLVELGIAVLLFLVGLKPDLTLVRSLGRFGANIAHHLRARGLRVLGVDFDPEAVRHWHDQGFAAVYGDASDPEMIAGLPLAGVRWAVSTIPVPAGGLTHEDHRLALIDALRALRFAGRIAVTAHEEEKAEPLRQRGADLVLLPFRDAADRAAELLERPPAG